MKMTLLALLLATTCAAVPVFAFEKDVIETSAGPLEITFIGHGSLMFRYDGEVIQVDPYSKLADYAGFPKADLVLLTHEHQDHLDPQALRKVRGDQTAMILTQRCAEKIGEGMVMQNGDARKVAGIRIEAVPAYNIVHKRESGEPFHPKGAGNGYVLTFGDKRVYIAGDTENIPEMSELKAIDVAFLPMNLPYTMTPEMVADAALRFHPKVLYPYHYGETDPSRLTYLLRNHPEVEVRIRSMK
ncbi:MBL fold metallo-hydrolase [Geomesophilobacter sediminis]|uniref:MBL fold metallo-hydrolase n=2 Tax=Geomesophilobacter sediminis TaxID=2798584 RepID=A0A8J7M3A3_9BACT|nr:MBL fold metallo-hydrolase [Geomesophilobacter sediminis]MBJ6727764.1 MBL fold metallo-hydrolase [Geomesophilobacter sediminis]